MAIDSRFILRNAIDSFTVFITRGTAGLPFGIVSVVFCLLLPNSAYYFDTLVKIHFSRINYFFYYCDSQIKEPTLSTS